MYSCFLYSRVTWVLMISDKSERSMSSKLENDFDTW